MENRMGLVLVFIVAAVFGGLLVAWTAQTPKQRKTHSIKQEKFAAGQGRNPDKSLTGPHKSFTSNALIGGVTFGFIFTLFWAMGTGLGSSLGHLVFSGSATP
ncbi:hypothetical protein [Corynebacterium lubricantis]|uniref:hypothetical protein n=1 Tax=Corynebacterium lubricantis TaxID=541095 RepID=UPI00035D34EA|nr:hypothetical protein [Corynebacterium lubricantis]